MITGRKTRVASELLTTRYSLLIQNPRPSDPEAHQNHEPGDEQALFAGDVKRHGLQQAKWLQVGEDFAHHGFSLDLVPRRVG